MPVQGPGEGVAAPTNSGTSGSRRPKASGYTPVVSSMIPGVSVPNVNVPNVTVQTNPYAGMNYAEQAKAMGFVTPTVKTPGQLGLTDMDAFIKTLDALRKFQVPGLNMGQIGSNAARYAGQDIASQVAAYRLQQQDLLKTGRQQAGLINQAGIAAANLTAPWAQQIYNAYQNQADQALQTAQGYSGATRDAAIADAYAVKNQLAAIGSSQDPGTARAQAAYNTLRGLGVMGANTLGQQALAAQQGAYGIPQGMLGYAQAQAAGTQGAAMQEAAKINPLINQVEATRGQRTREYMTQLTQIAQADRDFKLRVIGQRADIVGQMGQLQQASNETKMAYANYVNVATQASNEIASSVAGFNQRQTEINEQVRHNQITEQQGAQQLALDAQQTNAQIAHWNQEAANAARQTQNQIDADRGWYYDAQGRPHAMPGNKLARNPDGSFAGFARLDPSQSPSVVSAKIAARGSDAAAAAELGKGLGWSVIGKGKNARVVPRPGHKLVRNPDGSWAGYAVRDPSQYSQGRQTKAAGRGFSNADVRMLGGDLAKWKTGDTGVSFRGKPQTDKSLIKTWSEAYDQAVIRLGDTPAGRKKAFEMVSATFGSPLSIASQGARVLKDKGLEMSEAIELTLANPPEVPLEFMWAAIARAYGVPLSAVMSYDVLGGRGTRSSTYGGA